MMSDDIELVREYAARQSEAAFAELVARYVDLVYSAALRQGGDAQLAEEITQAVFIILARKAGTLGRGTLLSGWLYRTARYVAADALKSRRRRQHYEQEASMESTLDDARTEEVWRELAPLLDEAMAGLGQADRDALMLRYFENKSLREVGSALGTSEEAAKKRVARGLEKLRSFFSKRGVAFSGAVIAGAVSANAVQAAPIALAKCVTAVAVAKGAAASSSILTLIEGALKIMAWTKAKTAVAVGAIIILATGTSLVVLKAVHLARVAAYPDIRGAWEGVMPMGEGIAKGDSSQTRIVLRLSRSNGVFSAAADAIELGRRDIPADGVVYKYPAIEIVLSPRTTYHGVVNADATEITFEGAVVLKRTATPSAIPAPLADSDFAPRPDSALQGYWEGTFGTGPDALPLHWKIAGQPDGTFRAEMDNPMQGANGQLASVVCDATGVKLILLTGSGMFQGELNSANTEMTGSWLQGGASTPSIFKRADYDAERAAEPVKDYSYASGNDLQGHWKGSWILPLGNVKVSIRFALDIAKLPDGTYAAALANLDQVNNNDPIPASDFQYSPPAVHMEWKWADHTKYEGKLENGKLTGTWFQGGGGFPLVFARSASE
jgi:RNA polymerase sigma factor (sigma-70 family)